jgi:tetratricopeptide (TPR) repeat protein
MRHLIRTFSLFCLAALAAITAQAEPGILWVKVLNLKNAPIRKISVGTEGPGASALTDDRGLARIKLAPQTRPGTWVTLEVSSGNYAFVSPWNRKVLIPPFENESENFVTVYLMTKGERDAVESGRFAVALAAKFNATLTPKLKDERTSEEERKAALAEVARSFGVTPEEADRAIREWGKKAVDPYDKGEIALYQQNYPEATAQLSKSYEMRKSAFEKALAEMVEVAFSLGQALDGQGRYREAVEKFREANALRSDDADIIGYLGIALLQAGHYAEAEPLLKRALSNREKTLGADHPGTATSLNNLAKLYDSQGKYAEAEPLYKRALTIREKAFGADDPDTATSLNNLAELYRAQGKYAEAEPLFKRALAIVEKELGAGHPDTAISLNNLAFLYASQGKYAEVEPLLKRALAIFEKSLGSDHPDTAASLNNLAELYRAQGKYGEAEPLFKRALAIDEKALGADHPGVATDLNNLAELYRAQGRYSEAEPLYKRALAIFEKSLGADHPNTAGSLNNLAELYRAQGEYAEAEPLLKRALAISEKALGTDHPDTATSLNNLAMLYDSQGKRAEAEPLLKRALAILERTLGAEHPNFAKGLDNYAYLLRKMNREAEAAKLEARAKEIRAKADKK